MDRDTDLRLVYRDGPSEKAIGRELRRSSGEPGWRELAVPASASGLGLALGGAALVVQDPALGMAGLSLGTGGGALWARYKLAETQERVVAASAKEITAAALGLTDALVAENRRLREHVEREA